MIERYICMRCPACGCAQTKTSCTRTDPEQNAVKRRRHCLECGEGFSTIEIIHPEKPTRRVYQREAKTKLELVDARVQDRDAALIAGGEQWFEYCEKYHDPRLPLPSKRVQEISLHKCRVHWRDCPADLLKESVLWLLDRGLHLDIP